MSQNTAFIFCIGRELLEGLVLDRNANFMAGKLSEAGCRVRSIQVLDDDEAVMVSAFENALQQKPAYVFTTGGMGPGHDDITRDCVAKAAKVRLVRDERAVEMVSKSYRRLFAKGVVDDPSLNEERLRMAMLPEGATCFENPIGSAPAVRLQVGPTRFFLLPGVPQELQHMFNLYVVPALKADGPGSHKAARHVDFPGRDESVLTRALAEISRRYPAVSTKAIPQSEDRGPGIRITLLGEHTDAGELTRLLDRAEADLRARLGLEVRGRATTGDSSTD